MTETNAGCSTVQGDATRIEIQADAFHLDPGRRDERTGRRLRSPASWQPPLSCVEALADRFQGGLVKLGPGIPFEDVPDIEGAELEFVSLGGRLSQSHLWLGTLATAPGHRRATMLPLGLTEAGPPDYSDLRHDAGFDSVLCVPDPALERSGLHGSVSRRFGLQEPVAGLGLFTGDAPPSSPWFTSFHVEATMPWRADRVAHWLRQHDTGHVEIKTRDRAADPDQLQSTPVGFRDRSPAPYSYFEWAGPSWPSSRDGWTTPLCRSNRTVNRTGIRCSADPVQGQQRHRFHALTPRLFQQTVQFQRRQIQVVGAFNEQDRGDESSQARPIRLVLCRLRLLDLAPDAIADASARGGGALPDPLQYEILLLHVLPRLWVASALPALSTTGRTRGLQPTAFQRIPLPDHWNTSRLKMGRAGLRGHACPFATESLEIPPKSERKSPAMD